MIIVQCKLELSRKYKDMLKDIMRKQSACMKYAYNRLLEGKTRKELKKELQSIFSVNSRYVDDAIFKAQTLINACIERNKSPKKVIFGGRNPISKLEEQKEISKGRLKQEKNEYRQKPIKRQIKQLGKEINMLKNFNSEPLTQESVNQRKEQVRGGAILTFPILEKSFSRDFSPLRSYLVDWDRVAYRLAPVLGAGAMANQIPPVSAGLPEMAGYKYANLKCSFGHFS